jgi:hypothetical protein
MNLFFVRPTRIFPIFVISLDFELFWGVAESRTIKNYGRNIEGEWQAVPKILALFDRYGISATWATVGMLMCRDYSQWCEIRPKVLPGYVRSQSSTYRLAPIVRRNPRLFFARPLVEKILETKGQEIGSHTYSHFYCAEPGVEVEQFFADCICQNYIFSEFGLTPRTLVLPRNQVIRDFILAAESSGVIGYRGNPSHWFYRDGHFMPFGSFGRILRKVDGYVPLSSNHIANAGQDDMVNGPRNIPASMFLRPTTNLPFLDTLHLSRIKAGMGEAAKTGGAFHLWWHPHNFGVNTDRNLALLESLLQYYSVLRDQYGMQSVSMGDYAKMVSL